MTRAVVRDPDTAYIDRWLWIPKKHINPWAVKARTSAYTASGKEMITWWETATHVVVPRAYSLPEEFSAPVVDLRPTTWPEVNWNCLAETRNASDASAWGKLMAADDGLLHLGCGKGKTVNALRKIAYEQAPAMVVVHTKDLMIQWVERACEFLQIDGNMITPDQIGFVQGKKKEWDKPLVIAMIQTLVNLDIPPEVLSRFKLVVYDECHHLSAPTWISQASLGYGKRLGLTATPDNPHGTHILYMLHLGKIFHSDVKQELIPQCYFVRLPSQVDLASREVLDSTGQLSLGKLYGVLAQDEQRNAYILHELQQALGNGRKILGLSWSKAHCGILAEEIPEAGLCTGDVALDQRRDHVNTRDIVFGTMPLGKEGLDRKDLDVVAILTPFKDRNMLQQVIGRIQRPYGAAPIAIFFDDYRIPPCHALCNHLRKHLRRWGYPITEITRG